MDCKQVRALLSAYVDGELDARSSLEMEEHLRSCAGCTAALETVRQTKSAVAGMAPRFEAPDAVRKAAMGIGKEIAPRRPFVFVQALAAAACLVLVFGAGWFLGRGRPVVSSGLEATMVSSHVRALMADHLADVISTDKHTVKPWFNGKVDFSPPVNDFASQGFPLTGGRLEYLDGKRVAVLVYGRQKHIIDVYVSPSSETFGVSEGSINGYNTLHWAGNQFEFWAVSDLNTAELNQFVALVQNGAK